MASWLSRATEAFRKPPPPLPEPFHIKCDCGGVVTGERVAAAQRPSCPACGRPVFVLPISVYPAPIRKKKPPPGATARGNVDESGSDRERGSHEATAVAASAASVKTGAASGRKQPATVDQKPIIQPPGILLESRTRILTPFRLVALAIVMIGMLTGWGLWRRHRVESAKANVVTATDLGMKAFHEGDFITAARELSRARDAVDLLQRTDPEAESIRRHAREAIAGDQLLMSGLFELLSDYATRPPTTLQPNSQFEAARQPWLLLDTVIANPDDNVPCILDMPVLIEDKRFRIEIKSNAVKIAARRAQTTGSPRVIFAAQPVEIRAPTDNQSDAVLVLDGKTAFLWTNLEAYRALGYVESQEEELQLTRDLLARQLEQMEESK